MGDLSIKGTKTHVRGGHEQTVNCLRFERADDAKGSLHVISCSHKRRMCKWDLEGKLISSQNIGDNAPFAVTCTFPFKSKKDKQKQQPLTVVASASIDVWSRKDT